VLLAERSCFQSYLEFQILLVLDRLLTSHRGQKTLINLNLQLLRYFVPKSNK
jgi:hypothetical protein